MSKKKPREYYILSKTDGKWYSGYTSNLRNRIKKHNNGLVTETN
ncbi:MAG: GIY-YIG nuclease family protein [Bacteroidales bacterium]|nr:GIY-YIG nuclease family protein [Bacteroidales bacterium]